MQRTIGEILRDPRWYTGVTWSRCGVAGRRMMMGRLPSCTAHDVDRVLTRKGFIVTHQRESHRYYKSPITGTIVTSVAMHPEDLNRSLLKKILKQVVLSE